MILEIGFFAACFNGFGDSQNKPDTPINLIAANVAEIVIAAWKQSHDRGWFEIRA